LYIFQQLPSISTIFTIFQQLSSFHNNFHHFSSCSSFSNNFYATWRPTFWRFWRPTPGVLPTLIQTLRKRSKRSFFSNTALLLGGMYVIHRLNDLEHGEQEIVSDNVKHLKVMDSTVKYLAQTAEKVNSQGQLLNETIAKLNNNNYLFENLELNERISTLINSYMLLKQELNFRYIEIVSILDFASHGYISTPLIKHEEFKKMILEGKINDNYRHIINLNQLDSLQIKKLCEITVYEEENIPYVIISLPLTSKSSSNHFELMRLKPIPKLENNIATIIKLESNLIVYNTKNIQSYMLLEDLSECKEYHEKYYCNYLNNFHENIDNCIAQVLRNNQTDFSKLSSCKLSMVKVSDVNVIRLHTLNSYMVVSTENFNAKFQDSLNIHESNIISVEKGVNIIHSINPGYLTFKTYNLRFYPQNQENMKYDKKFDFYSFNYTTPNMSVIQEANPVQFNALSSTSILSIDEVHRLSTQVEHLADASNNKLLLMTTSNNLIYVFIAIVAFVIVFAICIVLLYFKFNSILKLKNIIKIAHEKF